MKHTILSKTRYSHRNCLDNGDARSGSADMAVDREAAEVGTLHWNNLDTLHTVVATLVVDTPDIQKEEVVVGSLRRAAVAEPELMKGILGVDKVARILTKIQHPNSGSNQKTPKEKGKA